MRREISENVSRVGEVSATLLPLPIVSRRGLVSSCGDLASWVLTCEFGGIGKCMEGGNGGVAVTVGEVGERGVFSCSSFLCEKERTMGLRKERGDRQDRVCCWTLGSASSLVPRGGDTVITGRPPLFRICDVELWLVNSNEVDFCARSVFTG